MGIAAKHAYRFGYLKSEQWQNVRAEVLARNNGRCVICMAQSLSNDVHHLRYPKNVWHTKPIHCVLLCRRCHELVHSFYSGKMTEKRWREVIDNIRKLITFRLKKKCRQVRKDAGRTRKRLISPLVRDLNHLKKTFRNQQRIKSIMDPSFCAVCKRKSVTKSKEVVHRTIWPICDECWNLSVSEFGDDRRWRHFKPFMIKQREKYKLTALIVDANTPTNDAIGSEFASLGRWWS